MKRQPDSWDAVEGLIAKILDRPSESLHPAVRSSNDMSRSQNITAIYDEETQREDLVMMGKFTVDVLTKQYPRKDTLEIIILNADNLGLIDILKRGMVKT